MDLEKWISIVKDYMIKTGIATKEITLCKESFKPIFESGKTPYNYLVEEYGREFIKLHQKWHFNKLRKSRKD